MPEPLVSIPQKRAHAFQRSHGNLLLHKVTSPMTTTIRILPCSKCGTILIIFFSDITYGLEKNGGGIIIFGLSMN
jgi:hypothetical protein